jgi:hypothetical protein
MTIGVPVLFTDRSAAVTADENSAQRMTAVPVKKRLPFIAFSFTLILKGLVDFLDAMNYPAASSGVSQKTEIVDAAAEFPSAAVD